MDDTTALVVILAVGAGLFLYSRSQKQGPIYTTMPGGAQSRPTGSPPPLAYQLGAAACVVYGGSQGGPAGAALGGLAAPACGAVGKAIGTGVEAVYDTVKGWFD